MLGPEPLLNVIGNICSALHAAKLLRGPYLWLKDRHGCLLSLRLCVHVHGVRSSILCNPLRKQHTQRHGAKLMGYHTSFRRKQNATHRNLATKKKKNKKTELKQEQGKKRGNRCNDQHYLQRSVLFQRNKILRHAGSFDALCLLTFQRGDAKANDNEILNQSNHSVFHWLPSNTNKNIFREGREVTQRVVRLRYGSKSHAGAWKPWSNFTAIRSSSQLLGSLTALKYTGWHNMKCYQNELFTQIFKEKKMMQKFDSHVQLG